MAFAQDFQFVFAVLLCARLYTWTTRFQSVARKIVTFLLFLLQRKFIFYKPKEVLPFLFLHYLYMLRQTPTAAVVASLRERESDYMK
jgi:hypothetical protein